MTPNATRRAQACWVANFRHVSLITFAAPRNSHQKTRIAQKSETNAAAES
jgi:hypothetical protein